MLIDEEMDHGPIVTQEKMNISNWPPKASELEETLARRGGQMLTEIIPKWVAGKIEAHVQNHEKATFTKKITKEDGLINLDDNPEKNYRKIQAFNIWPRTYFFIKHNNRKIRIIITDANFSNGKLIIKKVIPEGRKEVSYEVFLKTHKLD